MRSFRRAGAGLVCLLALAGCAGDPAAEIEARRARYSAELGGFTVRDQPGEERRVILDVLVRFDGKQPLPGLTLDVSIADAGGKERERRRVWIETVGAGPGGVQLSVPLEDVEYRPGDGFWVEVRSAIPAAERGDYREFGAAP